MWVNGAVVRTMSYRCLALTATKTGWSERGDFTMGHKNKKSLVRQVQENLQEKLDRGVGTSKHLDKRTGSTGDKIYSFGTFKSYLKHNIQFTN